MSYQVLARKWRPRRFDELVGQEHVSRALINGLDNDRLHHAFLFTGTRGVGKTTIARIFAKALNCEKGVSSEPCGECPVCVDVDEGRFVDLIEVDGASRTKVDDTRELLDNVQYAPNRGRYKVYLIDEVHMLSTHSFNALLKTLEEPPPHVKFLLATTDPQKLPVTVLSRCLQFNLKRLDTEAIAAYLKSLLEREGVDAEDEAVELIARGADGSMRDGLSLLDQAIANGGGRLQADEVRAMIGTVERDKLNAMVDALAAGDGKALLDAIDSLAEFGPDFASVLRELGALFHRVALVQTVEGWKEDDDVDRWAQAFDAASVQLNYQIAVQARSQLNLAPDARTGFEMALLRMLAFVPAIGATSAPTGGGSSVQQPAQAVPKSNPEPSSRGLPSQPSAREAAAPPPVDPPPPEDTAPTPARAQEETASAPKDWTELVGRLGLRGGASVLAANAILVETRENCFELQVDPDHAYLRTDSCENQVKDAMKRLLGQHLKIEFVTREVKVESPSQRRRKSESQRMQAARKAVEDDPLVRRLKSEFDAEVVEGSIQPR